MRLLLWLLPNAHPLRPLPAPSAARQSRQGKGCVCEEGVRLITTGPRFKPLRPHNHRRAMQFWTEHRTATLTFRQLLSYGTCLDVPLGCSIMLSIHELPFLNTQYVIEYDPNETPEAPEYSTFGQLERTASPFTRCCIEFGI
jgi:hypothetical protein